jgi:hemolysin activation/secretion protein
MRSLLLSTSGLRVTAVITMLNLIPALAHAQAYQRIAPATPSLQEAPEISAPPVPVAASTDHTVLLKRVNGMIFVPTLDDIHRAGMPAAEPQSFGINARQVALLNRAKFLRQMKPFVGRPLTVADLQQIRVIVNAWYRQHGRPFVSVVIPPQNVSNGILQVAVTEYRVAQVDVTGNKWFASALLKREGGFAPGQTLSLKGVQAGLDRLNGNPFRSATATFHPGAAPDTTDVVIHAKDHFPVSVYAGFDNAGVPSLGAAEWNVGGTWGNVFGQGQTLAYQYTHSLSNRYSAHALSWTAPLPWHDQIQIFGSYSTETPIMGSSYFSENGQSGQASIRYIHNLPNLALPGNADLSQTAQIGYDYKTTNNNLAFGGFNVFRSRAEIDQFPLIYNVTETDHFGQTTVNNEFVFSPGGLTSADNKLAYETIVPGSGPRYMYDNISVSRTTYLPYRFSALTRVAGQLSNRNLLYSEQVGAGGPTSVRGYYTDTALGSDGVLFSQEFRAAPFSLTRLAQIHSAIQDEEQIGVFYDYGHVSQVAPIPNSVNEADLSSLGVELHSSLSDHATLSFDIGWQLRKAPETDHRGGFGNVALVVQY